jgi:ArsR family transcriptional regulator
MDTTIFEALSDERRLGIVQLLSSGEKCVCEISSALGMSDALASHHLKALRESGLVVTARKGRWLHCRLDPAALQQLSASLQAIAEDAACAQETAPSCCGNALRVLAKGERA